MIGGCGGGGADAITVNYNGSMDVCGIITTHHPNQKQHQGVRLPLFLVA
jgi:hypothetical protein